MTASHDFTPPGNGAPNPSNGASDETPPWDEQPLKPEHIEYLAARAVPLEIALAAGLASVDATQAAQLLGLPAVPSGGIAIAYPRLEPKYYRIRTDGGEAGSKFMAMPGRGAPIYDAVAATGREPDGPLVVVEGPIKALALVAGGIRSVGLGGAETGCTKDHELDSSFAHLEFPTPEVVLLPDADLSTNYGVMRGQARLALAMLSANNFSVRIARLPGPGKGGPDDYLAVNGADALREIIAGGGPVRPSDVASKLAKLEKDERTREISALLADKFFLVCVLVWGTAEIFTVRELFREGRATKAFDAALKQTQDALRKANRYESPTAGPDTGPYRIRDGKFFFVRKVFAEGGEIEILEQLTNFTAEIKRETTLDDGVELRRELVIQATSDTGRDLGTHGIRAEEFNGRSWVIEKLGSRATVLGTSGAMNHTRAAVQLFSRDAELIAAFSHTGWRKIDDRLVYLHANGAVGADNVRVQLEGTLARYQLPNECEDLGGALRHSLRLLDVAIDAVAVPLFCATYAAPLSHWIPMSFVMWLWGRTGSLKTELAALCQAHYGPFDRDHLPATWISTITALENIFSKTKDALCTADDFVPRSTHDLDEMRRKGAQLAQSVGNNSSRQRMTSTLQSRPDRPPRGLVLVTGEDVLHGESTFSRVFAMRHERRNVDIDVLTEMQRSRARLPTAMRGYVEWLASQEAWLVATAPDHLLDLRRDFSRDGNHLRAPDATARLALGGEMFTAFAQSVGALTDSDGRELTHRIRSALQAATASQAVQAVERKPTTRFLRMLGNLITQERLRLACRKEEPPIQPIGAEVFAGWAEGELLWLLPDAVYGAVASALRSGGETFPVGAETLWSLFSAEGVLARRGAEHFTVQVTLGGKRRRVLEVLASKLDDGGSDPESPDPGPGAPAVSPVAHDFSGKNPQPEKPQVHSTPQRSGAAGAASPVSPLKNSEDTYDRPQHDVRPADTSFSYAEGSVPVAAGETGEAVTNGADRAAIPTGYSFSGSPNQTEKPCAAGAATGAAPYYLITDPDQLPAVAEAVASAPTVALDCETTGLDPFKDRVRLVQLGLPDGRIYVIDTWATGGLGPVAEALCGALWLGHNLHFDIGMMQKLGARPAKLVDTMLAAQVLDCGLHLGTKGYFRLASVLSRLLRIEIDKTEQRSDWSGQLTPAQFAYAALDVQHLHALAAVLVRDLESRGLAPTADLEFDVLPAVVDMQLAGVCFDRERWTALTERRRREAAEARAFVERELGIKNANSATKQVLPALQKRLGAGVTATNAGALAPYRGDPVVDALREFKVAQAFATGHGESVLAAMGRRADGLVRADWHQIGTTGRMSCSDPPLLSLPKSADVRSCVVAPPGYVLVAADYSQIELRVAAQVTGDARLLEVFRSGGDPHRMTAAIIAGIPESEVTKEQRSRAKPPNFGFLFAMGPARFVVYALADYGVVFTLEEARAFKAGYLRAYPGIARWQKQIAASMPAEVRTLGGRIRAFPDRHDGYSERLNHPVQGTALDGFKAAMAILHPRLAGFGAWIMLAVHDELVVVAPADRAEEVKALVEAGMIEGMARFVTAVPIVVEAKIVNNWAEAK